jgi:hypothetical protein
VLGNSERAVREHYHDEQPTETINRVAGSIRDRGRSPAREAQDAGAAPSPLPVVDRLARVEALIAEIDSKAERRGLQEATIEKLKQAAVEEVLGTATGE